MAHLISQEIEMPTMVTPLKQQDETIKKEDSIGERGKLTVLEDCHFVGSHLDFESNTEKCET